MHQEPLKEIKLWPIAVIGAILIFGGIWLINAMNTGNLFWFLPFQPTYQPSEIEIYYYGEQYSVEVGSEEYMILANGLTESFSKFRNSSLINLGMSDETEKGYYEQEFVIIVHYAEPVQFNTAVRMEGINKLLIPIDGRHDGQGFFFMGKDDLWLVGVLQMNDGSSLQRALSQIGYEVK